MSYLVCHVRICWNSTEKRGCRNTDGHSLSKELFLGREIVFLLFETELVLYRLYCLCKYCGKMEATKPYLMHFLKPHEEYIILR